MIRLTLCTLLLSATAATADLAVRFDEGAPKDRFTLTNTGDCALPAMEVTLNLGTAPAGLIFDVTGAGAGVEVFQPFEMVAGGDALVELPTVLDGDNAVKLRLRGLAAGAHVAFTVDVDDTAGGREITVSGSEIAGASVQMAMGGGMQSAVMDATARAMVPVGACTS
ncbi:aggregation factor core [uncultured Sulfitobacter sp.]|uniref:aggregation factor core n=1 Tax=uncultured Sulfitobacter sp. TaxID=191468 RepID=UPI002607C907|nr:aggregation factor core [uncultured Sulfitobacter sp.]